MTLKSGLEVTEDHSTWYQWRSQEFDLGGIRFN